MRRFGSSGLLLVLCAMLAAWSPETPGQVFKIRSADMPAPHPDPDPSTPPPVVPWPAEAVPQAPPGFSVSVFARIATSTGWMAVAPNGDIFLSEPLTGKILLLRDSKNSGQADLITVFSDGFRRPHGLVLHDGCLYVSDPRTLWRIPYAEGATVGGKPEQVSAIAGAPSDEKATARDLAFDSRGTIYWGFASLHDAAEDPAPDATIRAIAPGGAGTTFASGLSTVAALSFYPLSGNLFATVDERRELGPGLVPDYFTHIAPDAFYGWPYAYIGKHPDPVWGPRRPDMVAKTTAPDLLLEPGATPMGFAFYAGGKFPRPYQGDAFIALHGSWKQGAPVGYKIVHVPLRNGTPVGQYENFVTGFLQPAASSAQILGRPTDIAVAKDGSLLITDDIGQTVWRVTYTGK